jgi:branched-chain amino acid transport system permease protein
VLNGIGLGMLYFLLAVGLSVIFGLLQFVNFAHGAFYLLGAYLTYDLTTRGFSFWLAMPAAALIVAGRRGADRGGCCCIASTSCRIPSTSW